MSFYALTSAYGLAIRLSKTRMSRLQVVIRRWLRKEELRRDRKRMIFRLCPHYIFLYTTRRFAWTLAELECARPPASFRERWLDR
jgi:hypothetical protein